ncbi:hypothetical protein POF50_008205 [Streptomyces sp. SL13]|uniref:Uncharacterized protein n=1 Tax=Streptantibioticus silvisoli TaxID=2705255 RepID=A0AA90K8D1_9ACTN|nr:hypothetical protein [Streptantibioticus silvisoli]MDI5963458.1 hypothetical protein [Streptantibioticus silvisoli]MDI5969327.1 hypothetical protein [Streptantibioticus silvisoli]
MTRMLGLRRNVLGPAPLCLRGAVDAEGVPAKSVARQIELPP